jgi:hypothetical protein
MADDEGVLGNLPHSRPGRRSDKRDAGRPPSRPKRPAPAATRQAQEPPEAPAHARGPIDDIAPVRAEPGPSRTDDLVGATAKLAGTGLRVAGGVAREVLRRLPRP